MTGTEPAWEQGAPAKTTGPVLVVDDDAELQRTLQWLLEDEGYTVETASNGEEALALAHEWRPVLVILDLNLPALDGEGVAEGLRSLYGPGLPLIVVSSDGMLVDRAIGIGAATWLSKPFEIDDFVAAVHRVLPR